MPAVLSTVIAPALPLAKLTGNDTHRVLAEGA